MPLRLLSTLLALAAFILTLPAHAEEWSLSIRETTTADGAALTLLAEPGRLVITRSVGDSMPTLVGIIDLQEEESAAIGVAVIDAMDANLDEKPLVSERPQELTTDIHLRLGDRAKQYRVGDIGVGPLLALTETVNSMVGVESRLMYPLAASRSPAVGRPIVAGLDIEHFRTEVRILNQQGNDVAAVLRKLRREVNSSDDRRAMEAEQILDRVAIWHTQQLDAVQSLLLADRPAAYAQASHLAQVLRRDQLGRPFSEIERRLSQNPTELREIRAELAFREALVLGEDVGLDGDLDVVNWSRPNQEKAARAIKLLEAVGDRWDRTAAADRSAQLLKVWHRRVQVLEKMEPGWTYTYGFSLIPIGTEERISIITDTYGNVTTTIDEKIKYDQDTIHMAGTFRNTSSRAYRYTFTVAVSSHSGRGSMFTKEVDHRIIGSERIQSPLLEPGELWNWRADVAVTNVYNIRRAGIAQVEADQPQAAE